MSVVVVYPNFDDLVKKVRLKAEQTQDLGTVIKNYFQSVKNSFSSEKIEKSWN
jgi:hypothetical protein